MCAHTRGMADSQHKCMGNPVPSGPPNCLQKWSRKSFCTYVSNSVTPPNHSIIQSVTASLSQGRRAPVWGSRCSTLQQKHFACWTVKVSSCTFNLPKPRWYTRNQWMATMNIRECIDTSPLSVRAAWRDFGSPMIRCLFGASCPMPYCRRAPQSKMPMAQTISISTITTWPHSTGRTCKDFVSLFFLYENAAISNVHHSRSRYVGSHRRIICADFAKKNPMPCTPSSFLSGSV
mmetsp:Transcript_35518/g.82979  ORF Transcript_35518/g.82979 Transcript_35518/m.82979 type:complete len:233 (+) Transcript_35518:226-924(+)